MFKERLKKSVNRIGRLYMTNRNKRPKVKGIKYKRLEVLLIFSPTAEANLFDVNSPKNNEDIS